MTISMYKTSVPIFVQFLTSLSAVLDKAAAYAEAKKIEPSVLLNMRLAPDMFALVRQVRAATDHAINAHVELNGNAYADGVAVRGAAPYITYKLDISIAAAQGSKASVTGTCTVSPFSSLSMPVFTPWSRRS